MKNQIFHENDIIQERYKVLSLIGKGGIGTTYRVRDTENNRVVVLKTLDLQDVKDWKEIELFEREISTLKNIQHPHIPDYYDNFEIHWKNKTLYALVMEYINGKNLYNYVKEGGHFSAEEVKMVLEKLLTILAYIHNIKPPIIHRDINPKNVIRTPEGEFFLVDFGAVGTLVADTVAASTSNTFVGTIGYMPPEQLYGKSLPGSDIYSLGVTMLFLLSGKEPSSFNLKDLRLEYKPYVYISGDFRHLIDKMIEPSLEKRIKNAREALDLLKKEKIRRKKREEKKEEVIGEMATLSDVDRMIEVKRKKEEAKKKAEKLKERRQIKREEERELKETKKAEASPQRVFVNKTDEGVVVSVHQSPVFTFMKNSFSGDVIISILIAVFGLTLIIPLTVIVTEEMDFTLFNRTIDTVIIYILYVVLILLGKMIHSLIKKMKSFHLLLTNKNNVLIYRKDPRKPVVMGRKGQLTITIYNKATPSGGSNTSTKAWKKISFKIRDFTLADNGFNLKDADRVRGFCGNYKINLEKY